MLSNEQMDTLRTNSLIFNEMKQAEEFLTKWKLSWTVMLGLQDHCGLYSFSDELIPFTNAKTEDELISELFQEGYSIDWCDIDSHKSNRNIRFFNNGKVILSKVSKFSYNNFSSCNDYSFLYNLNDISKFIYTYDNNGEFYKVSVNDGRYLQCSNENINGGFIYNSGDEKKLKLSDPLKKDDKYSIKVDFNTFGNGIIKYFNLDIFSHKLSSRDKRVNGIYAIRVNSRDNKCTIKFISRKGTINTDITDYIIDRNSSLYSNLTNGAITIDELKPILREVIIAITNDEKYYSSLERVLSIDNEMISKLKEIKGEIPLPSLRNRINSFINNFESSKEKTRCR